MPRSPSLLCLKPPIGTAIAKLRSVLLEACLGCKGHEARSSAAPLPSLASTVCLTAVKAEATWTRLPNPGDKSRIPYCSFIAVLGYTYVTQLGLLAATISGPHTQRGSFEQLGCYECTISTFKTASRTRTLLMPCNPFLMTVLLLTATSRH